MKFNQVIAALVVGAFCAPAAMAKASVGLRVKSGSIHATSKRVKMSTSRASKGGKVRKPRKSTKPVVQPGPGGAL